jgi:hypothetical protein
VHAHDPNQHGPVDPGNSPDTILPRLRGQTSGSGSIIQLPGIVKSRPAKFQSVGSGTVLVGSLRGLAVSVVMVMVMVNSLAMAGGA